MAQNNWCGTADKMSKTTALNESALMQEVRAVMLNARFSQNQDTLLIIPTVVHIIHFNGIGDISDEQVEDGIRVVNEDFRRINADTIDGNPDFYPFAADCKIEFQLAKLDPNGNLTTGITRYDTIIFPHPEPENANFDNVKYVSHWPSNMYFNIWLTRIISGGTLGYAQYPGISFTYGGPWDTYGAVIKSNNWGTIGTAVSDGRTATHELGHCLGLYHTFLSASAGCGAECDTTGDEVCDTPPTTLTFNCLNSNLCSNDSLGPSAFETDMPDQLENHMGYNSCTNLFTSGQKDRMRGFLTTLDTLNGLWEYDNLIATGLIDVSAVSEEVSSKIKKVIKIVDLLGRNTTYKRNTIQFYLFDDGTVEKTIVVE